MTQKKLRIWRSAIGLFCVLSFGPFTDVALAAPSIEFTVASPYGDSEGTASGIVSGVDYTQYKVAGYIEVEDSIWTKPALASPLTDILPDGSFTFDITTGGYDAYATRVLAFLVCKDIDVEQIRCFQCCKGFLISEAAAMASYSRGPKARRIGFAGYQWTVKRRDFPAGPGGNYFSDKTGNVWADGLGLHLAINKRGNGKWYCAEVVLNKSLGYGTYRIVTNSRVDELNENVVGGLFLWDTKACELHNREIDIVEFARWGDAQEYTNAQNVVHPCDACPGCGDNCERFRIDLTSNRKLLTHFLIWSPDRAEFRTYRGNLSSLAPGSDSRLVHRWIYSGADLPVPGSENVRFNLWLFGGNPPSNGKRAEILVKDFSFARRQEVSIAFDGVSPYGDTDGYVWGHVAGADPSQYKVEAYILVRGGWWTKPYWNTPFTPIKSDGTWECDITTGGVDEEATKVAVFVAPKGAPARLAHGESSIPTAVFTDAVAHDRVTRQPQ